jgi:hypothetical protein
LALAGLVEEQMEVTILYHHLQLQILVEVVAELDHLVVAIHQTAELAAPVLL